MACRSSLVEQRGYKIDSSFYEGNKPVVNLSCLDFFSGLKTSASAGPKSMDILYRYSPFCLYGECSILVGKIFGF